MTFSHERATDPRRAVRSDRETLEEVVNAAAVAAEDDPLDNVGPGDIAGSEDEADAADMDDSLVRHSVKRRFAALALGPLLGYGADFEVLQYVYDLHLWSDLGSKKNLGYAVPMRVMMKGNSFSPLYWRAVHFALLDMVRQLGYPRIFWTIAPYEWSFPYHQFVRDEMAKLLHACLDLPVAETLHIAHVLLQTFRGLLLGATKARAHADWTSHLFRVVDGAGRRKRVHGFLRVEFQDGTRKAPTQDYHGSGRVHVHVLVFIDTDDLRQLDVPNLVSGSVPEDEDLAGYVRGSQLDRDRRSGWPVHEGATMWDDAQGMWRVRHPAADRAMGLRPYLVDVMDVLKCRQDFQLCNDDGLLRAYVTKYVSKFSDAASDEWLNDDADATTVATTVLMRYKPMEPEMVLQLFGARFRPWLVTTHSSGKRDFQTPWPDKPEMPEQVRLYEAAAWARGRISLLDFLRKTNARGDVVDWLRRLHRESADPHVALEDFAVAYRVRGEKIAAAETLSRLNDRFYGQWLVLHVPFRRVTDFVDDALLRRAPAEHRYLAMALTCEHPVARATWHDDARIAEELKMEAHTREHAATIIHMVAAHRRLLDDYLSARLDARAEASGRAERRADAASDAVAHVAGFNVNQRRFRERVDAAVDRALAAQTAEDDQTADAAREVAWNENKALVCLGPPGTGKTTVTHACIQRAIDRAGKVLFALPTAQLASRMRERYGSTVDVDTCHAAFMLNEELHVAMPILAAYALVVVDEVSQLQGNHFERIVRLWDMADRLPALVFLGDKWQIAGMGETRPWHTRAWRRTFRVTLHEVFRCKDPAFQKVLDALRTAKPGRALLRQLRTRKAWAPPGPPTVQGIRKLFHAHPDTTVLTCTRRGAAAVNDCALQALYPRYPAVVVLDADVETNPANYVTGQRKAPQDLRPGRLPIFYGMQVYLTRNVRKDIDFVNGMRATVEAYDPCNRGLRGAHCHWAHCCRLALDRHGARQCRVLPHPGGVRISHHQIPRRGAHARDRLPRRARRPRGRLHGAEPRGLRHRLADRRHRRRRALHAGKVSGVARPRRRDKPTVRARPGRENKESTWPRQPRSGTRGSLGVWTQRRIDQA